MKITAVIFLALFTLFQAGPVISLLFSEEPAIVLIDEEKHMDDPKPETKIKKDFSGYSIQLVNLSGKLRRVSHSHEELCPSPFLEQHTPPPNKG